MFGRLKNWFLKSEKLTLKQAKGLHLYTDAASYSFIAYICTKYITKIVGNFAKLNLSSQFSTKLFIHIHVFKFNVTTVLQNDCVFT